MERGTGAKRLRQAARAASPAALRLGIASARRGLRDLGTRPRLARRGAIGVEFEHLVSTVVQEVKGAAFAEGKLANLRLGAARLDGVVLAPGETFSFWKLVGRPTAAAGFALGRTIRGDAVAGELGGGLCQLSGLVYEAGLRAGLTPRERHPHSRDLYAEADRFTPLGLDATVVWPYKDLRLINRLAVPVQLRVAVGDGVVGASVWAEAVLPPAALELARIDHCDRREVRVVRRAPAGDPELISDDVYLV